MTFFINLGFEPEKTQGKFEISVCSLHCPKKTTFDLSKIMKMRALVNSVKNKMSIILKKSNDM